MKSSADLDARLVSLVQQTDWLMAALRAVRSQGLRSWCIGAGVIRNVVWDHLNRLSYASMPSDVDVAYFDASERALDRDGEIEERLRTLMPSVPWDVTNQALVHLWFEGFFGHAVSPLTSLEEAVSTWPEFATSVGVYLTTDDEVRVIAPYGLDDLFGQIVRRNPARVSLETYRQRVVQKDYRSRWPGVTVIAD